MFLMQFVPTASWTHMIRTALIQRSTGLQVVQIVCMGIAWKKYVFTDSGARMRAMKVPCVIQSYSVLRELHDGDDEVSCKSLEQAQPTAYTRAFVFKLYKHLAVAEICSSACWVAAHVIAATAATGIGVPPTVPTSAGGTGLNWGLGGSG